VLASIDSARRVLEEQFLPSEGQPLTRYYASDVSLKIAGWQSFEGNSFFDAFKTTSFTHWVSEECKAAQLPLLVLSVFCAEGVTVPHAIKLAEGIVHFAEDSSHEQVVSWKLPSTWNTILNDGADLTSLYG